MTTHTGSTRRRPRADDGTTPDARARVRALANGAVAAALSSLGLPPEVSVRVAPYVVRALAVVVAFSLLVTASVVTGLLQPGERAASTESYEAVPEDLRADLEGVARTHQIPVRVLLGIAAAQTDFARHSPYDGIDRTQPAGEEGTRRSIYPVVAPPIGDVAAADAQGLGMFLVSEDGARELDVDPQDVHAVADALAARIKEARDELLVEYPESTVDVDQSDALWGAVIDGLPLVDPAGGLFSCALPPNDPSVGDAVSSLFRCVLGREGRLAVPRVVRSSKGWAVAYTRGQEAAAQLTREALAVAHAAHPNAGTAWLKLSTLPSCASASQGVFPLTDTIWAHHQQTHPADDDPCNPQQNITAMAGWLGSQSKQLPATFSVDPTRPYAAELLRWAEIPVAAGNNPDRFARKGPAGNYETPAACMAQLVASLGAAASTSPGPVLSWERATDKSQQLLESARQLIDSFGLATSPLCLYAGEAPTVNEWYATVKQAAQQQLTTLTEEPGAEQASGTGPYADRVSFYRGVIGIADAASERTQPRAVIVGQDPVVGRYAAEPLVYRFPGVTESVAPVQLTGLTQRIIDNILYLGGLVPDDPRAGRTPAGLLSASTGGIGIALERIPDLEVIASVDDRLTHGVCGNGASHYMRTDLAPRWEALCAAAKAEGVDLYINSSWRSMADQVRLYNELGPSIAATPGSSPHQKGAALDLNTGQGLSPSDNDDRVYLWLHGIVGCADPDAKTYRQLAAPLSPQSYLASATPPCGKQQPVKRMQTYGLVPLCRAGAEQWADPAVILCARYGDAAQATLGGGGGGYRERWHIELGAILIPGGTTAGSAGTFGQVGCGGQITANPKDTRSVAIAVKTVFYCTLAARGLTGVAPVGNSPGYPSGSQFKNLAEQISSEAVVVAWCESGFTNVVNDWGYGGVFQMGESEFTNFAPGVPASLRTDAVVNIKSAAAYWLYGFDRYNGGGYWGGWGPWAVVNTDYDGPNEGVRYPVLARFAATSGPETGQYGRGAVPNWALDPTRWWGPQEGCGNVLGSARATWTPAPENPLPGR